VVKESWGLGIDELGGRGCRRLRKASSKLFRHGSSRAQPYSHPIDTLSLASIYKGLEIAPAAALLSADRETVC
jgi:hypothetical protein